MSDPYAESGEAVTFTVVDGAGVPHKAEVSAVAWSTPSETSDAPVLTPAPRRRNGAYTVEVGGRTMRFAAIVDRRVAVLRTAQWSSVNPAEVLAPGEAPRAELLARLAEAEGQLAAGFVAHSWKEGEVAGRGAAADFHKRMAAHHRKRAEETSKELTCKDELEAAKHDLYESLIRALPAEVAPVEPHAAELAELRTLHRAYAALRPELGPPTGINLRYEDSSLGDPPNDTLRIAIADGWIRSASVRSLSDRGPTDSLALGALVRRARELVAIHVQSLGERIADTQIEVQTKQASLTELSERQATVLRLLTRDNLPDPEGR